LDGNGRTSSASQRRVLCPEVFNQKFRAFGRTSKAVFLKVGGIAPLGAILNGKGAKNPKGAIGG